MNTNIINTGNRNLVLDGYATPNLSVPSETSSQTVLTVDATNNLVGINKIPTVALDVSGAAAISSALTVQTNALVVSSAGQVGIGTANPTNEFHVAGSVNVTGSLYVAGSLFSANTSTLEVSSSSIVLNQGGTDATSQGAGIIIQRSPSANAALTWNNTSSNFKAGPIGNQTSVIRAGGNTDGADITIGTNDGYAFTVQSGGINSIQVATNGNVTIFNNLNLSGSGDILVQGVSVANAALPPGTVVALAPGYFTNGSNSGFTATLGTNTVASVNSWLSSNGYSQWVVCDGSSYNIPSSPIFNGAGRFTPNLAPNLTNERFLAGSTVVGTSGGTNTFTHAHTLDTRLTSTDISHSHVTDQQTGLPNDTAVLGPFAGSTGATDAFSFSSTGSFPHTHTFGSHNHGDSTIYAAINISFPQNYQQETRGNFAAGSGSSVQIGSSGTGSSSVSFNSNVNAGGFGSLNNAPASGTLPSSSLNTSPHTHANPHSHDMTHVHTMPGAVHNHSVVPHTHPSSLTSFPTANFSHTHGPGGQIDNNTSIENRPQYLDVFYIIKVQ